MNGCSGTVNGTFDVDEMMVQMTGTYGGSNTCYGLFNQGQMTMRRR
jgi:hypothetical protein